MLNSTLISPHRRLLDPIVEKFLIEEAENLTRKDDIAVIIEVEEKDSSREAEIIEAIHKHFSYGSQKAATSVNEILKLGWKSLLVSFIFLLFTVLIAIAIPKFFPENSFMITVLELIIILAWVALWRPADLLLYEWRGIKKKGQLLRKLADCKVSFQ